VLKTISNFGHPLWITKEVSGQHSLEMLEQLITTIGCFTYTSLTPLWQGYFLTYKGMEAIMVLLLLLTEIYHFSR